MSPEANVNIEFVAEPIRSLPRLGGGVCWSLLVAEMAAEAATVPAPNPWTPEDPEGAAA